MREAAIIGIGIHPWGKFPEKSVHELNLEVAQMALKDAGIEWKEIQGLFCGQDPWGASRECWPGTPWRKTWARPASR